MDLAPLRFGCVTLSVFIDLSGLQEDWFVIKEEGKHLGSKFSKRKLLEFY